jgi:hypothetical protein
MTPMLNRRYSTLALCAVLGCGSSNPDEPGATSPDASTPLTSTDADTAACNPPDVLVVLDRTVSMAERPDGTKPPNTPAGHAESKWYSAVQAVEQLSSQFETSIRFGLELFPREPSSDVCISLAERLSGMTASNPDCEAGEVVVPPDGSTASAIASAIDPETTLLCKSTPIGAGLASAAAKLSAIRTPDREQYVLFVSDGSDTCSKAMALANTDALAADGVQTFVVAFDNGAPGGVDAGLLDNMACAGHTAPGFPAGCVDDGNGNYRAANPSGAALFLTADDGAALGTTFEQIAGAVCCGCIL